ncbi:hypothetical protein HpMS107_49740 [Helicobacter pylori]|jgi:IS5 family transposase
MPGESTILRLRHLLEKPKLTARILALVNDILRDKGLKLRASEVVDAKLISAPSSTKNASGERDPEMDQSKKGNQRYYGMKRTSNYRPPWKLAKKQKNRQCLALPVFSYVASFTECPWRASPRLRRNQA